MEDLQLKYISTKEARIMIPIKLLDFEKLAIDIIKRDTGVDLTGLMYCDYDEETYFIRTVINEDISEEDNEKLGVYSCDEWYLTTESILASLFYIEDPMLVDIYTSEEEVSTVTSGIDDLFCYIYIDYNSFIKDGLLQF